MDGPKAAKKRKLTEKSLPNALLQHPDFAENSRMYQDLLEMERKLDWNMMRKRAEVQDALAKNPMTTRTLRIFLSHTVSGQLWQTGGETQPNFETGEGIPAWSFKIEGRLLELPNQRHRDKTAPRKFSTFIKRMIVELDRDPAAFPEGNIVEWPRATGNHNPVLDGFTIRRTGDAPTKVRVLMYLEHFPEQYKVVAELANVLGIKEDSRLGVVQTLWNYIKLQGLQDKVDRRLIRADEKLKPIFGGESIKFHEIPQVINRFLTSPDPVVLHYTINPTIPPPERPSAWDVELKMEDTATKSRMTVLVTSSKESAQSLAKLDEEIAILAQSLQNSHLKRTFLESFAQDPAQFIQTWLESQSRDLETILGSGPSEGATVRQEELKRSEFFQLPWVEEIYRQAVAIAEGQRLAAKGMHLIRLFCERFAGSTRTTEFTVRLGKLRQWAGEVISLRDKSTATEEFRELEKDIELRRIGAERLLMASEGYYRALSKKKINEAFNDTDKLLPIDTLGVIMILHGEQFGEDSTFGNSLVNLGRAHCQVATLQEAYALTFKDTFMSSIQGLSEEIKEYEAVKRKLESKRLSYDAAVNKLEKLKGSKKDKDRREAEDEMERAKQRYEETAEDVRAHMEVIQDNELNQQKELTSFLDLEVNFVQNYLEVLQGVKADWKASAAPSDHRKESLKRIASKRSRETKSLSRSRRGSRSEKVYDSSDDESGSPTKVTLHARSESGSKPSSRPGSRLSLSRKRTNSTATAGGGEDKETEKEKATRRMSVTGWASSAVESMRKKNRDVDLFTTIGDNDPEHHEQESGSSFRKALTRRPSGRKKSKENLPNGSPQLPARILKPPSLQDRKIVRALHDFNGSSDELSFRAGSEIVVVNEVLDGWWMGELDGRTGLFPTTYVEVVTSKPSPPQRPNKPSNITNTKVPVDEEDYRRSLDDEEGYGTSDLDDEFGTKPLAHQRSPFYGGFADAASIVSSTTEEEEEQKFVPVPAKRPAFSSDDDSSLMSVARATPNSRSRTPIHNLDPIQRPLLSRDVVSETPMSNSSPTKKAPPPPPPRRPSNNALTATPPIPERRLNGSGIRTTTSVSLPATSYMSTPASSVSSHGHGSDRSPFESALDVSVGGGGKTSFRPRGGLVVPSILKIMDCSSALWELILLSVKLAISNFRFSSSLPHGPLLASYPVPLRAMTTTLKKRKIAVLGSRSVGKSSLVKQFIEILRGSLLTVTCKDEYSPINSQYAIGIHGYVLVYSITSRNSFDMIQIVYDKIVDFCGLSDIPCVIVGSKSDLTHNRQVDSTEGQKLAQENKTAWIETSAKNNVNVGKVFELCLQEIEKRTAPNQDSWCMFMNLRYINQTRNPSLFKWGKCGLYVDKGLIVVNKPPGLEIRKRPNDQSFTTIPIDIQRSLHLPSVPYPVHRLDKGTTGCLALARSATSARQLSQQFRQGTVDKSYLALVCGDRNTFSGTHGEIRAPIRYSNGRAQIGLDGKPAATDWELIGSSPTVPVSLLRLNLLTGHKHQLRVHLARCLEAPILGDELHSRTTTSESISHLTEVPDERMFLHSHEISFYRYRTSGPKRRFRLGIRSPLPHDLLRICKDLKIPLNGTDIDRVENGIVSDLDGYWLQTNRYEKMV
ncbi:hypothetical protein BDQ12DRAFT_666840 [Crucibulum laeve]|uniref:21S rRNA pseudouridine(2819) synthase n=1 Tax=Crucibulum laeve TaxID=68775 RepID=A0A5C3LXX1_9AGAR|nr:hypothetical protein BDQ12DRAFT_666840 [Crucibulum laeve]